MTYKEAAALVQKVLALKGDDLTEAQREALTIAAKLTEEAGDQQ